jgi:hypothetical protein
MDILCTTHDNRWNCLKDCDRKETTQNAVKDKFMGRRGRKKRTATTSSCTWFLGAARKLKSARLAVLLSTGDLVHTSSAVTTW